ncbi:MAG: hypothetical protein ACP5H3_03710 [Candidatus Aenigmatarchaeota archaeon]
MFPEEVLTKTKKGKIEVRNLIARGKFVWYDYRDPKTFENAENNKSRIFLKDEEGNVKSYFIIPLKEKRFLLIEAEKEEDKKVWNDKKKRVEDLWL